MSFYLVKKVRRRIDVEFGGTEESFTCEEADETERQE